MQEKKRLKLDGIKEFNRDSHLVDFFDLLLKIDKRNNPDLYKIEEEHD